jgi:hypothetical protein
MTSRGPLNYTTVIDPMKSVGECTALLVKHGASAIGTTWDKGKATGLTFQIRTVHGMRQYSLPVNTKGTLGALESAVRRGAIPPRYASPEQAERTGWRVLKDWLEAQLALIDAGVADMQEVMLPWMHLDEVTTVYHAFLENEKRLAIEE